VGRIRTWLLVVGVVGLGIAATVDAVRGGPAAPERDGETTEAVETGPTVETPAPQRWSRRARAELEAGGARGALLVANADCEVTEVEIPSLVVSRQGRPACAFSISPGPWIGAEPRVVAPGAEIVARCRDDGEAVELFGDGSTLLARVAGCAPAWTPDGRLGVLRDGGLVVVSPCDETWSCEEELLDRAGLGRLFGRNPWSFREPRLTAVAWLSPESYAALVRDDEQGVSAIAVLRGDELVGGPPFVYDELETLRASPRGGFAATRVGERGLVVVDAHGSFVGTTFRAASGIAWSPDETWSAYATAEGVWLVRTERGNRPLLLPFEAVDVAWR
jgi:hypothetical protein